MNEGQCKSSKHQRELMNGSNREKNTSSYQGNRKNECRKPMKTNRETKIVIESDEDTEINKNRMYTENRTVHQKLSLQIGSHQKKRKSINSMELIVHHWQEVCINDTTMSRFQNP